MTLNTSKTEFILIGLKQQLAKLTPANLTQYTLLLILASFFYEYLTFSDQIFALSKACYTHSNIYVNFAAFVHDILISNSQANTITSIVLCKLDYCNSLYYGLPEYQINRVQLIQNSLARAVVRAPKSFYRTLSLRSLHWLKIKERIDSKILSLTYEVLTTTEPSYLYDLIFLKLYRSTRSSNVVTLARPPLKVNNRSFRHISPRFWNELPKAQLGQSVDDKSLSLSLSPVHHHHHSHHHFHCAPLLLSSTLDSKLNFSINPSHRSLPYLFGRIVRI